MNIRVEMVDDKGFSAFTGGGCAETGVHIQVDKNLDEYTQEATVIHEVLCASLWMFPHEKIEQLTDDITEALEQLRGNK